MMKKLTLILIAFVSLSAFSRLENLWTNDDAHSQLSFTVTHLGIADVSGTINDFDATIRSTQADFSDAVFELKARVASLDTRVEARDNHLRSADFFAVEDYPFIHFKSKSMVKTGEGAYKLAGDLTLHGITREITVDLVYKGKVENPMNKKTTVGFQVNAVINRADFNVGNGFPPPMISNEVRIKADGEFTL